MAGSPGAPVRRVVLDANVLLQAPIRDTILRLAESRMLRVFWSPDILAEVARNFAAVSGSEDAPRRLAHLLAALESHFPEATVHGYESLLPTLRIAPHDRHVVGCAIVAGARTIITYNTRHFPAARLASYDVQAWHPDTLLRTILDHRPADVQRVVTQQGLQLHPPRTPTQVLARLAQDVPQFAAEALRLFDS